ncbi:MAG: DUF3592 domain-containing protein [Ruminiclostridium sp.]|nr:DUF3592 domain-containing protein [Ruminiclostridium sp.]
MKKKTGVASIFVVIMFLLFSVVFLLIGIFGKIGTDTFIASAEKTDAIITEIETYTERDSDGDRHTRHRVYVEYYVNGVRYNAKLNHYDSSMREGKTVDVYYDPANPAKIMSDNSVVFIIFICIGGAFALVTIAVAVALVISKRKHNNLIKNGTAYTGTIIDVRVITNIRVNGRHPYRADCEVINPLTQERFLFSSQNVYKDIRNMIGAPVVVYMDDNNPANHYVDIDRAIEDFNTNTGVVDYRY